MGKLETLNLVLTQLLISCTTLGRSLNHTGSPVLFFHFSNERFRWEIISKRPSKSKIPIYDYNMFMWTKPSPNLFQIMLKLTYNSLMLPSLSFRVPNKIKVTNWSQNETKLFRVGDVGKKVSSEGLSDGYIIFFLFSFCLIHSRWGGKSCCVVSFYFKVQSAHVCVRAHTHILFQGKGR